MQYQSVYRYVLEENGEIYRILLNFNIGSVFAYNSKGETIIRRTGLTLKNMIHTKKSIENAIKTKKVSR